ncbi:Fur family transcriptional regulator [Aureimonas populi]|uniref:Fur family transcriptional regulator n=1 Tax=Aureimonas populi TaxID=1701758 RepID=A0ABW5CGW8_9HYPH|nr:transcriptional repressor [Aureimonas populi]
MRREAKLTRNEALVLAALRRGTGAQTAYALLEALRGEGLRAPPQIYRALKSLGEKGLVHRLESRNAFLACAHEHIHGAGPHALVFLVCQRCSHIREVCDEALEARVKAMTTGQGFAPHAATLEISGLCAGCLAAG